MSINRIVSGLVLVAVCLNLSSLVCGTESKIPIDINILGISVSNDLPPSPTKLILFADFQKNEVEIPRGTPYTRLLNTDNHTGGLRWKQCAEFSVIPSLEQGHQRILWSVREDGLYHSWDGRSWDKKELWGPC
ncbi:hypothetical protein PHAVU_007G007600 [Phaseolus vulgaris]|uniref:Uncharacterized protein n=1 Tax=Phaseolus vulgaris TaxID=3885 RepID=V7BCR7_PHAVU|nr:hypothetical protein PHAVU_007G007600g [Phaseolus vulgaris]ESW14673.1 hypothetical protein PHAVU_007G007600g [Phaseolus vulgaris]